MEDEGFEADEQEEGDSAPAPRSESIIEVNSSDDEQPAYRPSAISTAAAANLGRRRPRPRPFAKAGGTKVRNTGIEKLQYSRGVDEWGRGARGGSRENRLKDLFGPSNEDLLPVLKTRDQWQDQETLPSRKEGLLRRSFYVRDEVMDREVKNKREWYSSTGRESFSKWQNSRTLTEEEGTPYMANAGPYSINMLMGSVKEPRQYTLEKGSYMSVAEPFNSNPDKRGWVINLGSRVQDAQWAPNEEGSTQYLAVAVEQKSLKGRQHKPMENPQAPAFSPTPSFPASIQIWAFDALENGKLDSSKSPRLEMVICTDWGALKQFRWCPIATADSVEADEGNVIQLGLLAGIWSDGRLRILDVSYQKPHATSTETQFIHYARSAFEVSIPHTIPTCVHWLSSTSLAVGTAAGTLAVWTLTRPNTFPPLTTIQAIQYNPQPWFYRHVADTYILTLTSGYPSRPTYLSISTADGFGKLIDLRSPIPDTANTSRGRIFSTAQAWHEHTQSFLMSDEAYLLRGNTIRRYYSNIYSMRLDSHITCCATSPVHPGTLIGGADGMVAAGNPVGRVLYAKETPWQQIWFVHEWRPPVERLPLRVWGSNSNIELDSDANNRRHEEVENSNDNASPQPTPLEDNDKANPNNSNFPTRISSSQAPPTSTNPDSQVSPDFLSKPLTRMSEGYRIKPAPLQSARQQGAPPSTKDYIKYITIFEEPSAVTALAWNPNLKFGTWAVAGMGSGLLRVEDLSV